MRTISVKALRPVKMAAKTLIFEDPNHATYMATRRVANDILSNKVEEVFIIDELFPKGHCEYAQIPMLATPSCW